MSRDSKFTGYPGFAESVNAIEDVNIRKLIVATLHSIALGETAGVTLENKEPGGDLADCRKYYLDLPGRSGAPRYRLVYQEITQNGLIHVKAVVAGKREHLDVYKAARIILGR